MFLLNCAVLLLMYAAILAGHACKSHSYQYNFLGELIKKLKILIIV